VFQLDSGGVRIGRTVAGRRRFALSYLTLDASDLAVLQAYEHGHNGPGPWVLWNTNDVNLLTVRQSSATSSTGTTSGFSIQSGTGTLLSQPAAYQRGPRSLGWFWGAAASGDQVLLLDPVVTAWYGIPVIAGLSYTWSFYVRGFGTDPAVSLTAGIDWRSSTSGILSTSSGLTSASSNSGYVRFTVTGTAPANAVFARPKITATGASITGDSNLSIDQLQFEQAAAASTWVAGTGLHPVDFADDVQDSRPWNADTLRTGPELVLQEVG
jgi:hypothetical protein